MGEKQNGTLSMIMLLPTELVHPRFAELCGYQGQARWVGLYWGIGDEVYVTDGRMCAVGEADAYLTYVTHWRIAPLLAPYHFGSSEDDATHWMIVDRTTRTISAALIADAEQCLCAQWPPLVPSAMTESDLEQLTDLIAQTLMKSQRSEQERRVQMAEDYKRLEDFRMWLDHGGDSTQERRCHCRHLLRSKEEQQQGLCFEYKIAAARNNHPLPARSVWERIKDRVRFRRPR